MKSALRAVAAAAVLGGASMGAMACGADPTLGTVCTFAFDFCPQGYVAADGRLLPVQQYAALFSLFGARYGGDGRTTFGVPDLRARTVVGVNPTGTVPGRSMINLGQTDGAEAVLLSVGNIPPLPVAGKATGAVNVPVSVNVPAANVTGGVPVFTTETNSALGSGVPSTANPLIGKVGNSQPVYFPYDAAKAVGAQQLSLKTAAATANGAAAGNIDVTVAGTTTGNSLPVKLLDPRMALTVCIVTEGIYPQRPY